MSEPIVFVDSSEVRPGKLDELRAALADLVEFVETNEPRPFSYSVYLNEDQTRMTVVQVHPDSASMELHMTLAASAFPKFVELLKLKTMDVYGKPSEELLGMIRQKIDLLGDATVVVHEHQAGFDRH